MVSRRQHFRPEASLLVFSHLRRRLQCQCGWEEYAIGYFGGERTTRLTVMARFRREDGRLACRKKRADAESAAMPETLTQEMDKGMTVKSFICYD
jgi:hypothetical protein